MECLVKSLGTSFSENNLEKFNSFEFDIFVPTDYVWTAASQCYIKIITSSGKSMHAKVTGDGYFTSVNGDNYGTEIDITTQNIYISPGTSHVTITSKYDIILISMPHINEGNNPVVSAIDTKYFRGLISCTEITARSLIKGDIANLQLCEALTIIGSLGSSEITGDIAALSKCSRLTQINLPGNNSLYGDIATLANLLSISTIDLRTSAVGGSIEKFIEKQISNGRTSASVIVRSPNSTQILWRGTTLNYSGYTTTVAWSLDSGTTYNITISADNIQDVTNAKYNSATGVWTYL